MSETTQIKKQENKVEGRAAIYAQGNVFKTLFITSLPVLILMVTNTLYQLVDASIAANMVSYGGGLMTGSVVSMISMPVILVMMASLTLTNIGFGTIFAQKLGAKDEEGAKSAISTMHLTNIIIVLIGILLSFLLVKPWLNLMEIDLDTIGKLKVDGSNMTLHQDAIISMTIYAIAIGFSSFQGIISRQLRSEGHIKAAAYLPMISIPFNILFDIILMGPANMGVSGAAIATLIATIITTITILGYTLYVSKKGETYFSFSVFKYGVDWKLFGFMCLIGFAPFAMQIGRAYSQILSMVFYREIGTVGSLQLVSSALRPMMIIMMPVMAIIQTSAAMIGYNFGAKNNDRVSKTIYSALVLVVLLSLPQYIWIMAWPDSMYWLFGASSLIGDETIWGVITTPNGQEVNMLFRMSKSEANQIYWTYMGLSIISSLPAIVTIYYISTRKIGWAMLQTFNSFFLTFTIVILSFYFTVGQDVATLNDALSVVMLDDGTLQQMGPTATMEYNPNLASFFYWMPVWYIVSQAVTWPLFIFVRYKDGKRIKQEAIDLEKSQSEMNQPIVQEQKD